MSGTRVALVGSIAAGLDCRDAAFSRMSGSKVREACRIAARWLERQGSP
jgi:hypothetical protein